MPLLAQQESLVGVSAVGLAERDLPVLLRPLRMTVQARGLAYSLLVTPAKEAQVQAAGAGPHEIVFAVLQLSGQPCSTDVLHDLLASVRQFLQDKVERLKQRLNEALTLLPNEAEIPELLQKIAALVEQSDCEMATFEPQGEVVSGFYARIPVKMAIVGNYHSIAVFFDKVSKLARIVNVTDIQFSSPKLQNKKVVLKAEFLATTFKFVEQKGAASPANNTGFKK